jgi:hypothetical protein
MLPPFNKIETRSWDTQWRGYVLMCASKKDYSITTVESISGEKQTARIIKILTEKVIEHELKTGQTRTDIEKEIFHNGHAIAVGRLVNSEYMLKDHEQRAYVEHHYYLWSHIYEDVTPIQPFPFKGSLGFKKLTTEDIAKIKLL